MGPRIAALRVLRQSRATRLDARQRVDAPQMRTKAEQTPGDEAITMTEQLCECFGASGLHASTHGLGDGRRHCDLCGWPVQPKSVDVLTAANAHGT